VLIVSHLPLVGEIVAELYGKRNPISLLKNHNKRHVMSLVEP
ncbi:phosphohistidine phosphatase SixA, partial [Haemophilus influenzae]